jgi:hypothetical protein
LEENIFLSGHAWRQDASGIIHVVIASVGEAIRHKVGFPPSLFLGQEDPRLHNAIKQKGLGIMRPNPFSIIEGDMGFEPMTFSSGVLSWISGANIFKGLQGAGCTCIAAFCNLCATICHGLQSENNGNKNIQFSGLETKAYTHRKWYPLEQEG